MSEAAITDEHFFKDLVTACKTLANLRVSWETQDPDAKYANPGQQFHFFHFADLAPGLQHHKATLQRLSLDVRKVLYSAGAHKSNAIVPLAVVLGVPPPGVQIHDRFPDYRGIGSFASLSALRDLRISVCMMGPFTSVEKFIEMLPESLESLVLLSPTQYGQPSIEELVQGILARGSTRLSKLKLVNDLEIGGNF